MALQCDVCGFKVPPGTRFCPKCGLEILEQHERPGRASSPTKDVFEWDDAPANDSKVKEYSVSAEEQPTWAADKLRDALVEAQTRLAEGYVRETAASLKQLAPQIAQPAKFRAAYHRLIQAVETKQQATREQALKLADAGDAARLIALLSGPAMNEMEPEEICAIALATAQKMYEARDAESANDVLRLSAFRTLRDQTLLQQHRLLETLVQRRRSWQHWRQSVTLLGSVSIAGGVGLIAWAWFLWQSGLGYARWFVLPGMLSAAALLLYLPKLQPWLDKKFREYSKEKSLGEWLQSWRNRRRPRR